MTRDELEAAIWRVWPCVPRQAGAVDAILAAADAYAATHEHAGIIAERRAAIVAARMTLPRSTRAGSVHFARLGRYKACGIGTRLTTDPAEVTCGRCKQTMALRAAS
jgi:hypothetical protein